MWDQHTKWVEEGATPARDIYRGRHGRNTIYFPSIKNRRQVICESALEANYCLWLEWDKDVRNYYAQPKTFRWESNGKHLRYTPDFFVTHCTGADHFTEVKPDFNKTSPTYRATLKAFLRYCDDHGGVFKWADAYSIKQQTRLDNLRVLYTNIHRIQPIECDYCLNFLATQGPAFTMNELCKSPRAPSLRAISWAIFCGHLLADLELPLNLNTSLIKKSDNHEQQIFTQLSVYSTLSERSRPTA